MANIAPNRILVTGSAGQLGKEFQLLAASLPNSQWLFTTKAELDITEPESINPIFADFKPQICINCAAYTAVDKAESEKDLAHTVNVLGPANLVSACRQWDTYMVHFSSDYVYHNGLNRPLRETDPTQPQSIYAQTKLGGETEVLDYEAGLVIRTSWVYSAFGHNFVKTMRRLGQEKKELRVVYDQIGTPTYAWDIVRQVYELLGHSVRPAGIFNFSNEGVCSWYDFALAIMEEEQFPCRVSPILSLDYPTAAQRPPYSVLEKSKWKKLSLTSIPHWRSSLRHCLQRLQTG